MPKNLRIVVGSDNAGFQYKQAIRRDLEAAEAVAAVIDVGVESDTDELTYPNVAVTAAQMIAAGDADRAMLFCGTGLGVAIAANKVPTIRAVTAHDMFSVERSVLSNNAQVLCMGQRVIGLELARLLVQHWLQFEFDETSNSAAKVAAIGEYESSLHTALDAEHPTGC